MAGTGYIKGKERIAISSASATVTTKGVRRQALDQPTTVSISGSSARNASALSAGTYDLMSDVDVAVRQGDSTVVAVWGTDQMLPAGQWYGPFEVTGASDGYFAGETSAATGTLYIKEREEQS